MFTNLLFLIFVLMLTSIAPDIQGEAYLNSPSAAFTEALGLYAMILSFIALFAYVFRNYRNHHPPWPLYIVNGLLISYLSFFYFYLLAHHFYRTLPVVAESQAFLTLLSLLFYFMGLAVYHYCSYGEHTVDTQYRRPGRLNHVFTQLRFIAPFSLPFLIFSFVADLTLLFPEAYMLYFNVPSEESPEAYVLLISTSLVFLACMIMFFPALLQYAWGCEYLEESELKDRLDRLCKRAGFTHAGLKTWSVMNHVVTAAVMGVVPKFRYVMFTKRLLYTFEPQQIEAILAHEIGHSQRRHLIFYPFMIMGMLILLTVFSSFFGEAIDHHFALYQLMHPSGAYIKLYPFVVLLISSLMILSYFRIVYGFFSRMFERQADLHVFELGLPGYHMLEALDRVAIINGNNHDEPCWHHYSIRQRMNFLEDAIKNPQIIQRHHWKVRVSTAIFFLLLLSSSFIFLMHPFYSNYPTLKPIAESIETHSRQAREIISRNDRMKIAESYIQRYQLIGNHEIIKAVISKSLLLYGADRIAGLAEFYAAQILLEESEDKAATHLMIEAWRQFDFSRVDKEAKASFQQTSYQLIKKRWKAGERSQPDVLELLRILKIHASDSEKQND